MDESVMMLGGGGGGAILPFTEKLKSHTCPSSYFAVRLTQNLYKLLHLHLLLNVG